MSYVYIMNKNDHEKILICDENINPISERVDKNIAPRSKAFYVKFPGGYIGAYASMGGPMLFLNNEKYNFKDSSWGVSVRKGGKVNEACFYGFSQGDFSFEYPVVELDPLDPWSEEQFDDFYIWLAMKKNDPEFIDMWTEEV